MRIFSGHRGPVRSLAYSPDGTLLASGSEDNTVRLWDIATGEQRAVLRGHASYIDGLIFHPDGHLLAAREAYGALRFWEVKHGLDLGYRLSQWADALAPAQQRNSQRHLPGHTNPVGALAFAPGSAVLASGGEDGILRLWEIATGRELAAFDWGFGPVYTAAFAPDGMTAAAGGRDFRVVLWDLDVS